MNCGSCGHPTQINWGGADNIQCESCHQGLDPVDDNAEQPRTDSHYQKQQPIEPSCDQGATQSSEPFQIFSRKQLAWMGLITGIVAIALLNWEFSYRSAIESIAREIFSYRNRGSGVLGINACLIAAVWYMRVQIGIALAFIIGVAINLCAYLAKKV
ncbi:MAG: hypothetical protein V7629_20045 [Motiliproteus sp.]